MKPPVSYFGGKSRLAPWIVSLLPPHQVYIEPFCGSAAVLFAKPQAKHEVINDVDGDVVNFFKVLRDRVDDLELACALSPYSRQEYTDVATDDEISVVDDLERARRWWVRSTQSFGQSAGADFGWSISINEWVCRPRQLQTRLGRFAAAATRLAGAFIENGDAIECITRYGRPDAVIYADPPYLGTTRTSFNDERGLRRRPGGDYRHEFESDDDHRALAAALHATPATVLLSGYPSALYDDLYADWHRVERSVALHMSNGKSNTRPRRLEVIWCNRAIDEGQLDLAGREGGQVTSPPGDNPQEPSTKAATAMVGLR